MQINTCIVNQIIHKCAADIKIDGIYMICHDRFENIKIVKILSKTFHNCRHVITSLAGKRADSWAAGRGKRKREVSWEDSGERCVE